MEIKSIKYWLNDKKTESRLYVTTSDGRRGCRYLTGNKFQPKGTKEGNLTEAEWATAKELSWVGGAWHSWYADSGYPMVKNVDRSEPDRFASDGI